MLCYVATYCELNGRCDHKHSAIAKAIGCSRASVAKDLMRICAEGWLEKVRGQYSCEYIATDLLQREIQMCQNGTSDVPKRNISSILRNEEDEKNTRARERDGAGAASASPSGESAPTLVPKQELQNLVEGLEVMRQSRRLNGRGRKEVTNGR